MADTSAKPDLIIRNARLIDGSGAPSRTGDLAVTDDRIVALGTLNGIQGAREIEFTVALPKTISGKIRRVELREKEREGV